MWENGASDASSIEYDEQSDENVHEESCEESVEEYSEEIVSQQSLNEENDLSEHAEGEQDKEGTHGLSEESDYEPSEDSDYEPSEDIVYKSEQPAHVPCEEEEIEPVEETFQDSPHSDSSYEKNKISFKEANRKPCQGPLDASQLPNDSDNNHIEYQLQSVTTESNEKKKSLDAKDGDHHLTKKCNASQSLGTQSDVGSASTPQKRPESFKGCSDAANASVQQGHAGSSGKRRRSRWDPQPECNREEDESDRTGKRRKSRWAADDSQLKILGSIQPPDFMKKFVGANLDPEILKLENKLLKINGRLQNAEVRNVGFHGKLVRDRQEIIAKLIEKKSAFMPPLDYKPPNVYKKLYIPVTEYPCYNFIGLIIGPRGLTQKRMEKETGAKILLRGKGSVRDRQPPQKPNPSDNEDLHVLIEAENQKSLDDAVGMVEKLLIPVDEGMNDHKRAQLRELATLNGKLRHDNMCHTCGEEGHMKYACPSRSSTLTSGLSCETCGGSSHSTANCPLTVSTPDSSFCNQLKGSFFGDVGGTGGSTFSTPQISSRIPWQGGSTVSDVLPSYGSNSHSAPGSTPTTDGKSFKEDDDANLLVRYLPQTVDDNRIKELFSPFGRLIEAKVIKDRSTGCSKGYGFVRYDNPSNATTAVSCMNGYKIDGKTLAVKVAGKPLTPGPSSNSYPPSYPSPAMVSQDSPSLASWPGPPGSMLPDSFSSIESKNFALSPSSIFLRNSDSSSERSPPPHHVSVSSPLSFVQFPGNPDYTGSQYSSFITPSSSISPQLQGLSGGVLPFSWTATHPPGNGAFHCSYHVATPEL
ncbi:Splicing factor-like protein [Thalictrum thalictroides]|uniref:Splicing factor-like protein n=1 Tax=Thalictrum thalictroides TaxID=46969 RepID=A0A7J6W252_THATH|nr:Splicing factor-like protein [Thalictrum thalictroides]